MDPKDLILKMNKSMVSMWKAVGLSLVLIAYGLHYKEKAKQMLILKKKKMK